MQTIELIWRTAAIIRETHDAVTVIFETGEMPFQHKAGQYINVSLVIDGVRFTRSYSLSSCPDGDEKPAITVKRVEAGIVSNYIFNNAESIIEWNVSGPFGRFYIEEVSNQMRYVFIAGGSGITPIYSMIKHLIKNSAASIILIYCNRTGEDIIYSKALKYLENAYPHRFQVYHVLSKARDSDAFISKNNIRGRLSKLVLKKIIKSVVYEEQQGISFFICGPTGLIALSEDTIEAMSLVHCKVYKEYFQAEEDKEIAVELPVVPQEVLLYYYGQTNLLEVIPRQSILESALNDRIPMQYSCKSGTCGICKAKLINGEVHMQRNFALTNDELKGGYILLCQSHPLNNEVTVVVE